MIQLDLVTAPHVTALRMPAEPIIRSAEIDGDCRWTLRRAWGAGPPILWCGLNPSTADGVKDDPTMLREIGFSYRWGFGSLIKVNAFPFRSPDQAELRKWLKTEGSWEHRVENVARIRAILPGIDTWVAAWGNGLDLEQTDDFISSIHWDGKIPFNWKCLGTTGNGSPKHTLARGVHRIPDTSTLLPWHYEAPNEH